MTHITIRRNADIPAALEMAGRILIRDAKRKLAEVRQEELMEAIKKERAELNNEK